MEQPKRRDLPRTTTTATGVRTVIRAIDPEMVMVEDVADPSGLMRPAKHSCFECHDPGQDCADCHRSTRPAVRPASHSLGFKHRHAEPADEPTARCGWCPRPAGHRRRLPALPQRAQAGRPRRPMANLGPRPRGCARPRPVLDLPSQRPVRSLSLPAPRDAHARIQAGIPRLAGAAAS